VWTHAEAQRLIAAAEKHAPHWSTFLLFAIRTGLRFSELAELRWSEDFKLSGHVHVQRQYMAKPRATYTLGADGRRQRVVTTEARGSRVTPPKGKQTRKVALRPEVVKALDAHRAQQRADCLKRGKGERPDLVFTAPNGGRLNILGIRRMLTKLCRLARVPQTTSIHTTRHTFATVLLAAGEDLAWVSSQLGHSDQATTERHYKHWIDDSRRDAERGQRIDAAWGAK
jgi:integrase